MEQHAFIDGSYGARYLQGPVNMPSTLFIYRIRQKHLVAKW